MENYSNSACLRANSRREFPAKRKTPSEFFRFHISQFDPDIQKSLKERLEQELSDAECKCMTGRFSRLVNVFSGFSDIVKIGISEAEEIGNIISIIRSSESDEEKIKELVSKEMGERGYDSNKIAEWISYV